MKLCIFKVLFSQLRTSLIALNVIKIINKGVLRNMGYSWLFRQDNSESNSGVLNLKEMLNCSFS